MLRNRMLGGVSYGPFYAPDTGAGAGGAAAGAGAGDGTGKGDAGAAAGAAGAAAGAGVGGAAAAAGSAAGSGDAGAGAGAATGAAAGTIAAGAAAGAGAGTAPPKFPETWRQELAGEDKAFLKTLDRYASPQAFAQAHFQLLGKVSSGELKAPSKPPPENATPEQLTAWRKEQGLPENAEGYTAGLKLADGTVPGEADKPMLSNFAAMALGKNWSQAQYNDAVGWYYAQQDAARAQRDEADGAFHDQSLAALGQEWGKDFSANQRAIGSFLDANFPAEIKDAFLLARLPDGSLLGDNPAVLRALAQAGREANPAATLTLPGGGDAKGIDTRIAEIEGVYRKSVSGDNDARRQYYGTKDVPGLEAEYRQLLEAKERMAAKGKAA